jgi:periplasmic protein TonB
MKPGEREAAEPTASTAAAKPVVYTEDPSAWSTGEVMRLFLTPAIVTLLFVGGVYWIKQVLPASRSGQDEASTIQVHLLTRPAPAPIPTAEVSQPVIAAIAPHDDAPTEQSDHPAEKPVSGPTTPDPAPAETRGPVASTPSPADAPPSPAAIRYQQALLHHVARYQHYPRAARSARLYGAVSTIFSLRRDGTVLGVWVTSSSGEKIFDKEAVDTIWRAQPLPPIPRGLPDTLTIETTLVFEPS